MLSIRRLSDSLPVLRPAEATPWIVIVGRDLQHARQLANEVSNLHTCRIMMYSRVWDFLHAPPRLTIGTLVLAVEEIPLDMLAMRHVRTRWPGCRMIALGRAGCGLEERAARLSGASYFLVPVSTETWRAVLTHGENTIRAGI